MQLRAQVRNFLWVGVAAAVVHYATLIGLVESRLLAVLPATLFGYLLGGLVSYLLNRRHTYRSDRAHSEAVWRFIVVAGVGFLLTALFMQLLVTRRGVDYRVAQVLTTAVVLVWSFAAHRCWTFAQSRPSS